VFDLAHRDDDDMYFTKDHPFAPEESTEPEFETENDARWHHPPVHFVYDAVAERSRQLCEQGTTNGAF